MSALRELSPQFSTFSEHFLAARNTAVAVADEILRMTTGRIGELRKLVDYLTYVDPHVVFSANEILKRARELTFHGYDSTKTG